MLSPLLHCMQKRRRLYLSGQGRTISRTDGLPKDAAGRAESLLNIALGNIYDRKKHIMKEKLRLTVFSDSHGSVSDLRRAAELHLHDTDYFIFLGDGYREAVALLDSCGVPYLAVPGNCDLLITPPVPEELTADLGAARIFICHGYRYGVKGSLEGLAAVARARNADIALFGHTHVRCERYLPGGVDGEKPLRLFNPGSISRPREGAPCYGRVDIIRDGDRLDVLFSHAEV